MVSRYDGGELALILGFLKRANSVYEEEIYRLRETAPEGEGRGGASSFRVEFSEPSGTVPVRIAGGASGIAARVRLKGWASQLTFDDQTFGAVGSDVRLQSPGYEDAAGRYDVEVSGSASDLTLTTTPG